MGVERQVGGRVATIDHPHPSDLGSLRISDTNLYVFAQPGVNMGDVLDLRGASIAGR